MIFELLNIGKENAMTRDDLVRLTGLDDRKVRLLINQERELYPIISDSEHSGYWLPDLDNNGISEAQKCIRQFNARAISNVKAKRGLEKWIRQLEIRQLEIRGN